MADGPTDPINTRLIRRLASILTETGLTEIEVEHGDLRIRVARTVTIAATPALMPAPPAAPLTGSVPVSEEAPAASTVAGDTVKSPMVGTVYLQPAPDSPAFVKVGDSVTAGQTLLIIEAMKTMNPIPAPRAGVLRAILVADGEPVEYGEPLAVIE